MFRHRLFLPIILPESWYSSNFVVPNTAYATTESVEISGSGARALGNSYEGAVRDMYNNASYAQRTYTAFVNGNLESGVADDVTIINGQSTAVEAKYVDNWATSLRNPDSPIGSASFALDEQQAMIDQAAKYSAGFPGGVIYHTNSLDLANYYTQAFQNADIANFRFVITPATKH